MAREKTLFRRVLAHESVDYSNYTIAQLQETIHKISPVSLIFSVFPVSCKKQ